MSLNINEVMPYSQPGFQVDLDGDGDLDVGGTDPNFAAGYADYASIPGATRVPAAGLYLGQLQFTALELSGSATKVSWSYRHRESDTQALENLHRIMSDG